MILPYQGQPGFSLIEHLIALLVMSIGVLGMAGLQTISMQYARSALLQGEATMLINDMLDRIRANPSVNYGGPTPMLATSCVGHICTATQMRDFDLAGWQCSINSTHSTTGQIPACVTLGINGRMPGVRCSERGETCAGGSITRTGDGYVVTVQWTDQQPVSRATGRQRSVSLAMKTDPF